MQSKPDIESAVLLLFMLCQYFGGILHEGKYYGIVLYNSFLAYVGSRWIRYNDEDIEKGNKMSLGWFSITNIYERVN